MKNQIDAAGILKAQQERIKFLKRQLKMERKDKHRLTEALRNVTNQLDTFVHENPCPRSKDNLSPCRGCDGYETVEEGRTAIDIYGS